MGLLSHLTQRFGSQKLPKFLLLKASYSVIASVSGFTGFSLLSIVLASSHR